MVMLNMKFNYFVESGNCGMPVFRIYRFSEKNGLQQWSKDKRKWQTSSIYKTLDALKFAIKELFDNHKIEPLPRNLLHAVKNDIFLV
jgi:hypothetical protein